MMSNCFYIMLSCNVIWYEYLPLYVVVLTAWWFEHVY